MSEEAIQDILEQTESDPAFQALFDWFDYGRLHCTQLYCHCNDELSQALLHKAKDFSRPLAKEMALIWL